MSKLDYARNTVPSAYALEQFNRVLAAGEVPRGRILLFANTSSLGAYACCNVPKRHCYGWTNLPDREHFDAVVYHPRFMENLDVTTGSDWASIDVLAHEVGHHVTESQVPYASRAWRGELASDFYAGFILGRLGAAPGDLAGCDRVHFSLHGSKSHPDSVRRTHATHLGYVEGGGRGQVETDLDRLYEQQWERMCRWWNDAGDVGHPVNRK